MRTKHLWVITAAVLGVAAFACSPPNRAADLENDEDDITLPPTSKSAKRDAGGILEAGPPPGSDVELPPSDASTSSAPTLCDISTAAGGPTAPPPPPTPIPQCANPAPFDPSTYDKEIGAYSGPGAPRAACSPADIAQLASNLKNPNASTWADYRVNLSASCDACVFTRTADPRWGTVVLISADPTRGFVNFGACHAAVNESAECGRAFQYDQFCVNHACNGCAGGARTTCVNAAWSQGGACYQTHAVLPQRCPKLAGSMKLCGTSLADHAKIVCGGC